jgi:hypothetical protein
MQSVLLLIFSIDARTDCLAMASGFKDLLFNTKTGRPKEGLSISLLSNPGPALGMSQA